MSATKQTEASAAVIQAIDQAQAVGDLLSGMGLDLAETIGSNTVTPKAARKLARRLAAIGRDVALVRSSFFRSLRNANKRGS